MSGVDEIELGALRDLLTIAACSVPDQTAAIGIDRDGSVARQVTWRELDLLAHRYACGLAALGVGAGDVVAVMLPNVVEFVALAYAINEVGATYTGIPVAYGRNEMEAILSESGARVLVLPPTFRSNRNLEMARSLRGRLPSLATVVIHADAPDVELGELEVTLASLLDAPEVEGGPAQGSGICHLGFTSGTTGAPKGVMNSATSLAAVMNGLIGQLGPQAFGTPMVNLVGSPMGHHTGYLWGILLTARLQGTGVYLEQWSPELATRALAEHGVTAMFGAPTFLQDLMRVKATAGDLRSALGLYVMAGAPVPRDLPEAAKAKLGGFVCPAWGMTEYGIGICCRPDAPPEMLRTDGAPVPGCQARIVTEDGTPVEDGIAGELQIRGAGLFHGYYRRPDADAEAFADGWFRTGDVAARDPNGWIRLEGRTKDLVIRGGENIPVAETESLLLRHPAVQQAAVVGVPDDRLGERACAVVVAEAGAVLDLPSLCDYLLAQGLSKHFLPESLVVVDDLPVTPSGKIKKVEIRRLLAATS